MYEIDTEVRYHGSIEALHGEIFTIVGHIAGRYRLDGVATITDVRHASITPVGQTSVLDALARAISDETPVMITYVAADGDWTTRTIEPYELDTTRSGDLIVRAMDRLRGEPRTFRLDRIHTLDILPGAFALDRADLDQERDALARIRADIEQISPAGWDMDAARWTPGDPIIH